MLPRPCNSLGFSQWATSTYWLRQRKNKHVQTEKIVNYETNRSEVIAPAQKEGIERLPVSLKTRTRDFGIIALTNFLHVVLFARDLKAWQSVTGALSLIWFREASSARQRETNESWQFILSVTDRWSHELPPCSLLEGAEGWLLVDTDTTNRPLLNPTGFMFQQAEYELQHEEAENQSTSNTVIKLGRYYFMIYIFNPTIQSLGKFTILQLRY